MEENEEKLLNHNVDEDQNDDYQSCRATPEKSGKLYIPMKEFNDHSDTLDEIEGQIKLIPEVNILKPTSETLEVLNIMARASGRVEGGLSEGHVILAGDVYFIDGIRRVDFILVYKVDNESPNAAINANKRKIFEANLIEEGLEMEYDSNEESKLRFIKVHAPYEVLTRYAEILKFRLPMKETKDDEDEVDFPGSKGYGSLIDGEFIRDKIYKQLKWCYNKVFKVFQVDESIFPCQDKYFSAVYSRDREYLFNMSEDLFIPSMRSRIVDFIMQRKFYSDNPNDTYAFGIHRLIPDGVYYAAYPLHEGDYTDRRNIRGLLFHEWASLKKLYKCQPLDYIKDYFGIKIALYFAWLGFYTYMLIPASIVGFLCFLYGYLTFQTNQLSEDVCNSSNYTMCPLCDHFCDFWELKQTCLYANIASVMDNPATVFFAVFMSFWAATFLELWKRYSAEIAHHWDLTGFDIREEHPRPEYLIQLREVQEKKMNYVTKTLEPKVPFWTMKLPGTLLSFSCVIFLILLAFSAVLGVIMYRMSILAVLSFYGTDPLITSNAMLITTSTGACINLVCIVIFNQVYISLAGWLTEKELHRTQTQFDDSLSLKIYLLQFVNNYASIFYIAFFKGKIVGYPGKYIRLLGFRQEECGPGGCLVELCIQLAIIFVGKQVINTCMEMLIPMFWKYFNTYILKNLLLLFPGKHDENIAKTRWTKDLKLIEWGKQSLFNEYLEMVLQFGFVTIFVSAFPLAPLFAFLNNVFETRLDAKKILTFHRRPVGKRVSDIGIWYRILDALGKIAVLSNAFIIAFTSNFIPRLVYRFTVSENYTLDGFLNYSLSVFNVSDFPPHSALKFNRTDTVETCRYLAFREPPWKPNKYEFTDLYWHVLAARLAFVVVFENVVVLVIMIIKWCIPDKSPKLEEQIRREAYVTNEIIMEQELLRAKAEARDTQKNHTGSNDHIPYWKKFGPSSNLAMRLRLVSKQPGYDSNSPAVV